MQSMAVIRRRRRPATGARAEKARVLRGRFFSRSLDLNGKWTGETLVMVIGQLIITTIPIIITGW